MKKRYYILFCGILLGYIVQGQTLQSVTANGNSKTSNGLGTINGSEIVACSGDFATGDAGISIKATGNNTNGGYGELQTFYHGIGYNTPLILNKNGGSVGLGTIAPEGLFHIKTNQNSGGIVVEVPNVAWVGNPYLLLRRGGEETFRLEGVANIEGRLKAVAANVGVMTFYTGNNSEKMRIDAGGNVGIGTNAPAYKLDVSGGIHAADRGFLVPSLYLGSNTINDNVYQIQFGADDANQLGMGYYTAAKSIWNRFGLGVHVRENAEFSIKSSGWQNLFGIQGATGNTFVSGNLAIGTTTASNDQGWSRVVDVHGTGHAKMLVTTGNMRAGIFSHDDWNNPGPSARIGTETNHPLILMAGYGNDAMVINTNGRIGIGTHNPQSELAVAGTITSQKIKVTQTGWSDYVFDSSYQLQPLHQIEKYIQENKHLPEVPSAAEVKKEGVDVGDNQALLLKKIEELTLYIIQQNKRMDAQDKVIAELRAKVK